MLRKLIKLEFSSTARIYLIILLASLGFTALSCLSMVLTASFANSNPVLIMITTLPSTLLGSLLFSVMTAFPIYHGAWRFYKNLASDEGYLMHMLPVPTWMLVFSKMLTASVWAILNMLIGFLEYIANQVAYFYATYATMPDIELDVTSIMNMLNELLGVAFEFAPNLVYILINVALILLASLVFSIVSLYLCIAIGQLWTAHRILGSVLAYFALSTVANIVVTVLFVVFLLVSIGSMTAFNIVLAICTLLTIASCAVCYLITVRLFKNRLNLQ